MLKQMNHVGLTVDSIQETLDFYRKLTTVEIYGESILIEGDEVGEVIEVEKPEYVSCMVRIGANNFELIEHRSSKRNKLTAGHNDIGGVHLAFMVDDIQKVFEFVKELGIRTSTPQPYTATELGGYRTFFFRDLNGVLVEVGETGDNDDY